MIYQSLKRLDEAEIEFLEVVALDEAICHPVAKAAEGESIIGTDIADLLGHGSINTTTIYMHASAQVGDKVADRLGA